MNAKVSSRHNVPCLTLRNVLCLALGIALQPCATYAQAAQSQSDPLSLAVARARSGDVDASDVELIVKAGAIQAIRALEVQFARTIDLNTKTKIADGLVRLGDKDNTYWNFLLQQATLAVDSDLPDPWHDSQGHATGRQPSPEFIAWTQAHHVDVSTAIGSWIYDLSGKVLLLGETGDPRGIPLLQRALQSNNYQIAILGCKGFGKDPR